MTKDIPGLINPKTAEDCEKLGCPLFSKIPYLTCSVRALIDQSRHSANSRKDAIKAYSSQIPPECPAGYASA